MGGLASCNKQLAVSRILEPDEKIKLEGNLGEIIQKAYELGFKY
jgi:hypothetical protein